MQYKTFKYNKLVRNNFIQQRSQPGSQFYWTHLNDQDFIKQLSINLLQSCTTLTTSNDKTEIIQVLATIQEIVHAIQKIQHIDICDVEKVRTELNESDGNFDNKIFITFAEHLKDSPQERYCSAHPHQYPEIK